MDEELEVISPEKAQAMLRKDGLDLSPDEAMMVVEFLYEMAKIVVAHYLRER